MTELEKAIAVLREKYEKACRLEFVRNKMAWALYHAWKEYDGRNR